MKAERRDMRARAEKAPEKMVSLGWRIARMAAMRKVLSPISEARIIVKDWRVAWRAPLTSAPKKYSDMVDIVAARFWLWLFLRLLLFYVGYCWFGDEQKAEGI